jgi:hypothetical protein
MPASRIKLGRDAAFEAFLGTAVGEDGKGTNVTVLSMLARLGVDPWEEASELAAMPDGLARKRLEVLTGRFVDVPGLDGMQGGLISDLLARLPRPNAARGVTSVVGSLPPVMVHLGSPLVWFVGVALFLAWVFSLAQGH